MLKWLLLCCCCWLEEIYLQANEDLGKAWLFCAVAMSVSGIQSEWSAEGSSSLHRHISGKDRAKRCFFGSNSPHVAERQTLQNISFVWLVGKVLDSSQWLEVAEKQLLRSCCPEGVSMVSQLSRSSVNHSSSAKGRHGWTAELWCLSHAYKRMTGSAQWHVQV